MATHDYVIDNQSAPSLRADLNSALQAIVTQNSSATAPATTYANMIWYDTANNQLKKRNEANSAWVTLGTVDEGLGTFTPSGSPPSQDQSVWNTGTSTVESLISAAKLDDKIENKFNVTGTQPLYAARAWGVVDNSGVLLTGGNIASTSGTNPCTVTFTTAMPDANYVVNVTSFGNGGNTRYSTVTAKSASSFSMVNGVTLNGGMWFAVFR